MRVVDVLVWHPVDVVLSTKSEHQHRNHFQHSGGDSDDGGSLHEREWCTSFAKSRAVIGTRCDPNDDNKDQVDDFNHKTHCDEDLHDDEPGGHNKISDGLKLWCQNPPAAMIRSCRWVATDVEPSEADFPQPNPLESGVDAGPGYVPVRRNKRNYQTRQTHYVQTKRRQ